MSSSLVPPGPPGGGNRALGRVGAPVPPPPPPPSGRLGSTLMAMVFWGAGVSLAIAGMSALFGERRTTVVHHAPPAAARPASANNPALSRPIVDCAAEEETLKQCLAAQGNCAIYSQRVSECYARGAQGKRTQ